MKTHGDSLATDRLLSGRLNSILAVTSGALLGLSFPPSPIYSLAYVAFVPFFFLFERAKTYGQLTRHSYLFLLVFHLATVYWTGGFTHMKDSYLMAAGGLLLIFHPFFYIPPILGSHFVRKRFGLMWGIIGFIFLWIGFEYLYSLGDFSFPWLTIGNSQAYDLYRSQLVEYTSVYGLSFIILCFNVLAFIWIRYTTTNRWNFVSPQSVVSLSCLLLMYVVPWYYGRAAFRQHSIPESASRFKIGLVQPNIDPFEKWGEEGAADPIGEQMGIHLKETQSLAKDSVDLVLWCETAIPFRILSPLWGRYWMNLKNSLDSIDLPVLTGFPYQEIVDSSHASATAQRIQGSNLYSEDFNSVMLIVPHEPVREIYKKMRLVPFAERIPYAESLRFLVNPLKWSVGISGWGLGKDTVVFVVKSRDGSQAKFAGMICYESVFPDFVRQFALRGAQFLVILTNDSWWGNTSGAYQHIAFASFRAIENRRWVVQCANGGISAFVDPAGTIHEATSMYTMETISRTITMEVGDTFYDRHGDVFAQVCLLIAGGFLLVAILSTFYSSARRV